MIVLDKVWQLPQIVLGFIVLACIQIVAKEQWGDRPGVTFYRHRGLWGVSFGPIVIISVHHGDKTVAHEYGHSIQSRMIGPLYLLVVGIPSITMNILTRLGILRADRYYDRWPESWADKLGNVERK